MDIARYWIDADGVSVSRRADQVKDDCLGWVREKHRASLDCWDARTARRLRRIARELQKVPAANMAAITRIATKAGIEVRPDARK